MDRGYTLNRGKGQKRRGSMRSICASCGKRGIGPWKPITPFGDLQYTRDCRYCGTWETITHRQFCEINQPVAIGRRTSHKGE